MIDEVFETGFRIVKEIQTTQKEAMEQASRLIADSFLSGHHFYVSGSGHSHTVAEEFYARAGTLAFTIPILTSELTLTEHPTKSSFIERLSGYAAVLAELYDIQEKDVVLVASNSGRNAYPIELAMEAKKRGASVIAITSIQHSTSAPSRHASGKHLMDLADIVIDNCGVNGDSALKLDGMDAAVCPTSSMANSFIAQAVSVQCAQYILEAGRKPPVFVSLNSEGNEHVNDELFERYTRQYVKRR